MRNDFNALTDARLERLEERVDKVECLVAALWFITFIGSLANSVLFHKAVEALAQFFKRK